MKTAAIPVDKPSNEPQNADPATRWARLLVPLLCVIYLAECGWFIHSQSLTYDEPVHIAAGQDAWRSNRFQMWNDHPPLARLWCALPLLNDRWQIHAYGLVDGFRVDEIRPGPEALAWRARAMNVFLGLALALFLWDAARGMFSAGAGLLALALFVFSPPLIAHFSVATTDGAATLLIFVTAMSLWRWRVRQDWIATLRFGLVLGLLLLAKFSTPVIFVLAIVWTLVLKSDAIAHKPRQWNWDRALTAVVLAFLVVWAGYFFHVSRLTLRNHVLTATFPNRATVVYENVKSSRNFSLPVPAGEYLEGFRSLVRHNRFGQVSFFLGRISRRGFKAYYPVAIFLKWPIVLLVLCGVAVFLVSRSALCLPERWWLIASFPVTYLGFAIFSRFDIGDRHVLPIYPFFLLLASAVWEKVKERRGFGALIMMAVLLQAADTLRYAPDYLSYFNIFVVPTGSYKILSDSNLDWGQGLLALRKFERDHPTEKTWLAYFGSVEPRVYGIRSQPIGERERPTGTIVISASQLSGQFLQEPAAYHWLLEYPRIAVLNHSLYVYKVDKIHN
jgi:hypothetical protein